MSNAKNYCRVCGRSFDNRIMICPVCGSTDIALIEASKSTGKQSNRKQKSNTGQIVVIKAALITLSLCIAILGIHVTNGGSLFNWNQNSGQSDVPIYESLTAVSGETAELSEMETSDLPDTSTAETVAVTFPVETVPETKQTDTKVQAQPIVQPDDGSSIDSTDIHSYRYVHADVSWQTAWDESIKAGGYLARISSPTEYEYIVDLLDYYSSMTINYVYLGGMRDSHMEYHWKDVSGALFEEDISAVSSWYYKYWYPGEPSYSDPEQRKEGKALNENFVSLMHVKGLWYFNDSSGDLSRDYDDGYTKGKIGYLIEFEDT